MNELMSKKHKKGSTAVNYIKHLRIFAFAVSGCFSISVFASLVGIPMRITSSAVGLGICTTITRIKKSKSIMKK